MSKEFIIWLRDLSIKDIPIVGGKNASLGEMYRYLTKKGIQIPNGFAVSSSAFWYFLEKNGIKKRLKEIFTSYDLNSVRGVNEAGKRARNLILKAQFPETLEKEIVRNYKLLSREYNEEDVDVAIRSSATAEDLPGASFAGQHETFLNVRGVENLLRSIKKCFSSLFTDRAIAYREQKGFDHLKVALSVCIQKMVRSDLASSGVMFTLDPESGFRNVIVINSIFGLGEMIVKGKITPDEFYVFKPTLKQGYKAIFIKNLGRKTKKYIYKKDGGLKEIDVPKTQQMRFSLTDEDVLTLAKWAMIIEDHYGKPQDIEWAKDGKINQLFIVQARPETVHAPRIASVYEEFKLTSVKKPILTGIGVGNKIGQGRVNVIEDVSKIFEFKRGEVLVTKMTDPDWLPAIRIASAIVTDEGGRTCHAAIVSRELGIPCVVGTKRATKILKDDQEITVDCSMGQGRIFLGKIPFKVKRYNLERIPKLKVKISLNLGVPETAFYYSHFPVEGVGLAREEFIIAEKIRIHPLALYHYKDLKKQAENDPKIRRILKEIDEITIEHKDKKDHFIKELSEGIAQIACAFWPREVIVRFSDFKTNEYKALIGGELFEPQEENPMLGWRGASRYYDAKFQPAFEMECRAIKRAREVFGLKNIAVMIPFCRTPEEARTVLGLMKRFGLERKKNGLRVYIMCEIPSNVILAEEFLKISDGFSIGSNDLSQCILGMDRDNAKISTIANETHRAVKNMIASAIRTCNKMKKYSGICGDIPSTDIQFAKFLIREKISSISLSPDAVMRTIFGLVKK